MGDLSVELRNVTKRFGDVTAVRSMNLEVEKGEFVTLLGPSGCGKTTTLRMIAGLEVPDEGEILLDGSVVNDIPPYRRDTSTVFQNLALFPHLTVKENIAFGLRCKKVAESDIKQRVEEALELVRLQGYGHRRPAQLSGGQQQRVALARSLVLRPVVLLLDEPLASLDRKLADEMQVELKRIQESVGITFIYVTHDQKMALSTSDRIALMKDGLIVQLGIPDDIYEEPKTRFAADFMGIANIFTGKVTRREAGEVEIETEAGLRISAMEREDLDVDGHLSVCIRPEAVKINTGPAVETAGNMFPGIVKERIYQGEATELRITLTSGERIVARLNKESAAAGGQKGSEVLVTVDASKCCLLSED